MNQASLILVLVTFVVPGGVSIQASASGLHPFSLQQTPQAERLRAQDSSKSSDETVIKFEGLKNIYESDLLKALREKRASISKEDLVSSSKLDNAKRVVKEFLAARGYLNATITVRIDRARATTKTITFVVNEGERARIEGIQFEGNKVFSDQQLLDFIRQAKGDSNYTCLPSDEFDSEVFDYCLRRATFFLRGKGYLRAKLDEPKKEMTEHGLKLIVPVTEGELYRLGEIKLEGATVFTSAQVLERFNLQRGDVANGLAIGKWLQEDLKGAYGELGYLQYEYDVEPTYRSNPDNVSEGIVDLQITIWEGKRFIIRKINFAGTKPMPDDELRRLLLIHEGETFNQNKVVESVKNLYQLGLSDGDGERDVDYRTDEEEGLLDIVFTLKGYQRQTQIDNGHPVVTRHALPSPN